MKTKKNRKNQRLANIWTGVPNVSLQRLNNSAFYHNLYFTVDKDKHGALYWTAYSRATGKAVGLYHPDERMVVRGGERIPVERWQRCLQVLEVPKPNG